MIYNVADKIANGKMVLGTHVGFDSPFITEMMAGVGFDLIWIDAEHSALDKKDIQLHLLACRAANVAGIVRVPWNDHVQMKAVLDMGADGIIVPMIRNLEEAKTAIAGTHYPPYGVRGMGHRRVCNYGLTNKEAYIKNSDDHVWTILQIEHIDMIEDLEQIVQLDGVSAFVFGPNDFCMSMATTDRKYTPNDSEIVEIFDKAAEILKKYNKPFGVSGVFSEKFVETWTKRGASFICMDFDFHHILNSSKRILTGAKEVLEANGKTY